MNGEKLLRPVNRVAGVVTNQSGVDSYTEYVKICNCIEDYKRSMHALSDLISTTKSKDDKKLYGWQMQKMQAEISRLNQKRKLLNISRRESMNSLIVRECLKLFSDTEWAEIVGRAEVKFRAGEV